MKHDSAISHSELWENSGKRYRSQNASQIAQNQRRDRSSSNPSSAIGHLSVGIASLNDALPNHNRLVR
jgi:hypothetical protein